MTSARPPSGARVARIPQDVPEIAGLVELCFHDVLDYSARRMLRDVRWIAEMGGPAWRIACILGSVRTEEWLINCIWQADGRIVGNATVTRREPEADSWLISNVGVHPGYRRRGIARGLVNRALEEIRSHGGRAVYLQVDGANESAVRLYREAGFAEIGCRTSWLRTHGAPPRPTAGSAASEYAIAPRTPSEWREEFDLWQSVTPYGSAWNTPLAEKTFRPTLWKRLERSLEGETEIHVLARRAGRVEAALSAFSRRAGWEGSLIQRPGTGGHVERDLLAQAGKALPADQGILLETTPEAPEGILIELGFQKRRTFIWMRYTFDGGAP